MLLISAGALDQITRAHHPSIRQRRACQKVEPWRPDISLGQTILRVAILNCASRLKVLHSVLFLLLLGCSYICIRWFNYWSLWRSISLLCSLLLLALIVRVWTMLLLLLVCIQQEWLKVDLRFVRQLAFQVVCLSQRACINWVIGSLRSMHLLLVFKEAKLCIA